jgi:hypothetical protein
MTLKRYPTTKLLLTMFFSVFMSVLFVFLGAPFIKVLRNAFGAFIFWVSGFVAFLSFWFVGENFLPGLQTFAALLGSLWILIGVYTEFEIKGKTGLIADGLAIIAGFIVFTTSIWGVAVKSGVTISEFIKSAINTFNQQLISNQQASSSSFKLDPETILNQAPSAIVILLMLSLAFAKMLDSRAGLMMGLKIKNTVTKATLISFKAPDFFIWIMMFSFLLSFLKIQPELINVVASNVFNILLAVYFFQGLAVLEASFVAFNISSLMKFLIYFLIVGQLFFLLSLVGIIDYWVDFRARMKRMLKPENNRNGEHI